MCGIVAATSSSQVLNVIIDGLKTLEYRGYDSAGIAIQTENRIQVRKSTGKLHQLEGVIENAPINGKCAIGHTRWATHGEPTLSNAHPHLSNQSIAVVHNGIIENSRALRQMLTAAGYQFESETDTEVIPHLIHHYLSQGEGFSQASRSAIAMLQGSYALAITCIYEPGKIIAARKGSPLVIGVGKEGFFVASDLPALMNQTDRFYLLEEGDMAQITAETCNIYDRTGLQVQRALTRTTETIQSISKQGFSHFMQKEIFEQPKAAQATLDGAIKNQRVSEQLIDRDFTALLRKTKNIHIVACGTSWHAATVARYWLESIARIPCQVEIASEYRYRNPVVPDDTLFICISQSGETADTLAALRFAKSRRYIGTVGICNAANSSLDRECERTLLTKAGIEIGVASTKALTTQLIMLALLTLKIQELNHPDSVDTEKWLKQLTRLPQMIRSTLKLEPQIREIAMQIKEQENAFFVGRGAHYPIALEGALKLKEISYIHAEAYAAGELKHGPLAMIDDTIPVIAVCPNDQLLEKLASNIEEVRARGGQLYVFTNRKNTHLLTDKCKQVVEFDEADEFCSPILFNIPLQLLAYHAAVARGTDVDQPRNLAKSVTVE